MINHAKVPVCAHQAARAKATAWMPDSGDSKAKKLTAHIDALCGQMMAEATVDNHEQHRARQNEWSAALAKEKKRLSSASKSTSGPLAPTASAGIDKNSEVPPIDTRDWCATCILIKAYFHDEEQRVRKAEDRAEKGAAKGKRIYDTNPMSHDDQHLPMAADIFNKERTDRQHIYQTPFGMQTYSMDALTNARWDLKSHTGFHTWPHHDASGMSTWVHMRTGCKVWCPLIPDLPPTASFTQHDLFDAIRRNLKTAPCVDFQKTSQSLCLFLLPHDVL